MTDPVYSSDAASLLSGVAKGVVDNASRLGLTWQLMYATVSTTVGPLAILVDGDSVSIAATSLIGGLEGGSRVAVITVPPNNVYVIGKLPGEARRKNLMVVDNTVCDTNLSLSTSIQDLSGTSVTYTSLPACLVEANATFDVAATAGTATMQGFFAIDGVDQAAQAIMGLTTSVRMSISQQWLVSLTAGTHEFRLQAVISAGTGSALVRATHSNLTIKLWA